MRSSSSTCSAMAGALVRPGEQMPAAWIRRASISEEVMMKSPVEGWARRPAKARMVLRRFSVGVASSASVASTSVRLASTEVSSLSLTFTAVGPANTLPSTVGATQHALAQLGGRVEQHLVAAALRAVKEHVFALATVERCVSSPIMRATSSAWMPAALTTRLALMHSSPQRITMLFGSETIHFTGLFKSSSAPLATAFSAQAMVIS